MSNDFDYNNKQGKVVCPHGRDWYADQENLRRSRRDNERAKDKIATILTRSGVTVPREEIRVEQEDRDLVRNIAAGAAEIGLDYVLEQPPVKLGFVVVNEVIDWFKKRF